MAEFEAEEKIVMHYSDLTRRIAGEGSSAWAIHYRALARKAQGEDVIILSVGDPDFDTPTPIIEAAVASLRAGHTHYSDYRGDAELRQLIADHYHRRDGITITPDDVVVLSGAQCGLFSTALCLLEPGDEVIVPDPMYVTYEGVFGAAGARVVNVPLRPEDQFHLRIDDIVAVITPKTRAILINSPQNPTGVSLSHAEWQSLADLCRQHDLWLIVDEVYAELIFDGQHVNPATLVGMSERMVLISSLSKSHAMTGWRLGWVVGPARLIEHISNVALCMLYGVPTFIQAAAKIALAQTLPEVEQMKASYRRRRDLVCERLAAVPGCRVYRPQGGMFVMLDIRATQLTAKVFAERLLDGYGVSVLAGEAFGTSAAGHVRLSLAVAESSLRIACDRIARCIADLMATDKINSRQAAR